MGIRTKIAISFITVTLVIVGVVSLIEFKITDFSLFGASSNYLLIKSGIFIAVICILLISGIMALLNYWFYKIFEPINDLNDSVEKVYDGRELEIPENISKDTYSEIDKLANNLKLIANQLADVRSNLIIKEKELAEKSKIETIEKNDSKSNEPINEEIENDSQEKNEDYFPEFIGNSENIIEIKEKINKISGTQGTVLISGENGTGKEFIARYIHKKSNRASKSFISIDCKSLTDDLFDSELLGYKKESQTSELSDKIGLLSEADGGTIFFNGVDCLSNSIQNKILRLIVEGTYKHLGSTEQIKINIRFIFGTSKNLFKEVEKGTFREDLFYKINIIEINLLPLRNRKGDIRLLSEYYVNYYSRKHKRKLNSISDDFYEILEKSNWPSNISQLENVIERAILLTDFDYLDSSSVKMLVSEEDKMIFDVPKSGLSLTETMDKLEKQIISQTLQQTNGNYSKAASLLGVTRQNLNYKLRKYNLSKEDI